MVLLAYFHRYGYILLMLALIPAGGAVLLAAMIAGFGLYTILGTLLGYRHLYCSLQNANHQPMTPSVRRHAFTPKMKREYLAVGGIFLVLGIAMLVLFIFFPGA